MLHNLSQNFIRNILGLHQTEGAKWIIELPRIVREIEDLWDLKIGEPFSNLSYHFVAPCRSRDGRSEAVLKIAAPEQDSPMFREKKALEIFAARGAVKLQRFDENFCAMLLEKLTPGENLVKICRTDDARATSIAIRVMRRLLREPTGETADFPALSEWVAGLGRADGTGFAPPMVKKARSFFEKLTGSSKQRFFLHGDLHHQNILSAEREEFLAIDPKGITGDIGFEISTFLNNPRGWLISHPEREAIISNRLEQFSRAFEIEPENLRRWAYAEAVLSAWWTFEETKEDWEKWIACAEIWEAGESS